MMMLIKQEPSPEEEYVDKRDYEEEEGNVFLPSEDAPLVDDSEQISADEPPPLVMADVEEEEKGPEDMSMDIVVEAPCTGMVVDEGEGEGKGPALVNGTDEVEESEPPICEGDPEMMALQRMQQEAISMVAATVHSTD